MKLIMNTAIRVFAGLLAPCLVAAAVLAAGLGFTFTLAYLDSGQWTDLMLMAMMIGVSGAMTWGAINLVGFAITGKP